ncbi:MAG: hypothetical protein MH825_10740 [Cyanobacteria bacterium]|nr:hypothetical protein [Cyanobacteriota bacterium]
MAEPRPIRDQDRNRPIAPFPRLSRRCCWLASRSRDYWCDHDGAKPPIDSQPKRDRAPPPTQLRC